MREILFRGKTREGKWNESSAVFIRGELALMLTERPIKELIKDKNGEFVDVIFSFCTVDKNTVGQFTGLTDKNGKKIFEGDIVVTRFPKGDICCVGDVQFNSGVFGVEWTAHKKNKGMVGSWGQSHNLRRFDDDIINHIEVIGNIHDNPELLEVTE